VLLAIFVGVVFLYSLGSGRLARIVVTPPMLFTAAGMTALLVLRPADLEGLQRDAFLRVAEAGLMLLLFTDASRTDLRILRNIRALPMRLLSAGLLLTILLGTLAARVVFGRLSIWEAGILGAILAPTDAGLGQVIVTSPRVPLRIREALNVEAGLNDGLVVPFLMFFMAGDTARLGAFLVEQLGYGLLVGGVVGLGGGWLLGGARRRGWMAESFEQLGVVTLPVCCALASEAVGASMFIAAFTAGLCVQVGFEDAGTHSVAFAEEWGALLNLSVFFLFGALVVGAWPGLEPRVWVYALLSLTVVRMLPVAIALAVARLDAATVLFMGWFGPRGLASIVLGLVYLEQEIHTPGEPIVRFAVMATVLLSVFAHGVTTRPGIGLYAARIESAA
jgi:NhaP-type Na+/H+ or K+/H+ antiporter